MIHIASHHTRTCILLLALLSAGAVALANSTDDDKAQIMAVLDAQRAAWNRGNVDGYMDGYWKSDQLRFGSGGTVVFGWQATRDHFAARYDTAEKMGKLSMSDQVIDVFSDTDAMVFGHWHLQRVNGEELGGLFTLHFKKIDDEWLIVSDHSSSGE